MGLYDFDPDTYRRIIDLYDTDGVSFLTTLSDMADGTDNVLHAEFQWNRTGGLGTGTFTLDAVPDADTPQVGQWIVCRYSATSTWYRGKIDAVEVDSPNGTISLRTTSMWSVITETQVGGNPWWDKQPQTFGRYDYFYNDPDHATQVYTNLTNLKDVVQKLYDDYIAPWGNGTTIQLDVIDAPTDADSFASMTFRGGESLSQILRSIAEAAGNYSYGIDADNKFFFKPFDDVPQTTYTDSVNAKMSWTTDRDLMYNRLILTGGYVYGSPTPNGFYVWDYHAEDAASVAAYGVSKTLTVKIPWIRNHVDSQNFADSFFAKYAVPTTRYSITTIAQGHTLFPWKGSINVVDNRGTTVNKLVLDTVAVEFDAAPFFKFTTGPEEPKYPGSAVLEPKNGEQSTGGGGGGGDADHVSGFGSAILSGLSISSCQWPPCEIKTIGFYVTSAHPLSGYVIGDVYYSTKPVCPRTGITAWDMETPFGTFVTLDGLTAAEIEGRIGTAAFMRRFADHDKNGCKWFITGLVCEA